jgi:hypothetical protein
LADQKSAGTFPDRERVADMEKTLSSRPLTAIILVVVHKLVRIIVNRCEVSEVDLITAVLCQGMGEGSEGKIGYDGRVRENPQDASNTAETAHKLGTFLRLVRNEL